MECKTIYSSSLTGVFLLIFLFICYLYFVLVVLPWPWYRIPMCYWYVKEKEEKEEKESYKKINLKTYNSLWHSLVFNTSTRVSTTRVLFRICIDTRIVSGFTFQLSFSQNFFKKWWVNSFPPPTYLHTHTRPSNRANCTFQQKLPYLFPDFFFISTRQSLLYFFIFFVSVIFLFFNRSIHPQQPTILIHIFFSLHFSLTPPHSSRASSQESRKTNCARRLTIMMRMVAVPLILLSLSVLPSIWVNHWAAKSFKKLSKIWIRTDLV